MKLTPCRSRLFLLVLFFSLCCVSSCLAQKAEARKIVLVFLDEEKVSSPAERQWLEQTLGASPEFGALVFDDNIPPDEKAGLVFVEYFLGLKSEAKDNPRCIVISKTWLVPKVDSLEGRFDASLDDCLAGKETLVALNELAPPYVALRVDGFAAGDEAYPLVRSGSIRLFPKDDADKDEALAISKLEELLEAAPKPLIEKKPVVTWISSAGDMMLARNAGNILLSEGASALFGGVAEIFAESDLTLVNLEGALSSRGTSAQKTFTFRFEPPRALAAAIKNAGIGAVLLANNHALDYGETAMLDTLTYLDEAGIAFLGVGRNEEEVLTPFIFEKEGFSARFWGLASFPTESTGWNGLGNVAGDGRAGYLHARREGAEKLKAVFSGYAESDYAGGKESLNVLLFHGGDEWSHRPSAATRELYTDLVRGGADLIIGTHPHIVQGFEWVEGKLVFWSLGNFVFSGMENTGGGDESVVIRLGFCGNKVLYIEPFAVDLVGPRVRLAPDQKQKLEDFYCKSRELVH